MVNSRLSRILWECYVIVLTGLWDCVLPAAGGSYPWRSIRIPGASQRRGAAVPCGMPKQGVTRAQILSAMDAAGGDVSRAAQRLQITRKGLYDAIDRLGLWGTIDARYPRRHAGPPRVGPVRKFVRRLLG